ncbi:hypothetical protein [Streptomyces sp. NBC_00829]|uniref:hypothetical protein n=1 Tax=Streptomyces sp. NBC_00829 TaxID=2903679 RepID=UPI003865571C|nr:hypothetical protein OG293_20340 [Streptomyces sp. NBC_00829]
MSQYATAIQDASHEHDHFGPSGHDIRQPVRVHAVHWPGAGDEHWDTAHTMCGRSAATMAKAAHTGPDPSVWHAPRWAGLACEECDEAVRAAARSGAGR